MGRSGTKTVPILPLAQGSVLLPGVTLRIPLQNRGDIAAVLANVYSRASTPRPDASSITIGCVPINSPYLSPDGNKLLEDAVKSRKQDYEIDPAQAKARDLFRHGTVAKISGVQGRRQGELALIVEGVSRFKVEKVLQDRPYFEARVSIYEDDGKH